MKISEEAQATLSGLVIEQDLKQQEIDAVYNAIQEMLEHLDPVAPDYDEPAALTALYTEQRALSLQLFGLREDYRLAAEHYQAAEGWPRAYRVDLEKGEVYPLG